MRFRCYFSLILFWLMVALPVFAQMNAFTDSSIAPVFIIGDLKILSLPAMTAVTVVEKASYYIHESENVSVNDIAELAYERMLYRGYEKLAKWMKSGGNPLGPSFIIFPDDPRTTDPAKLSCILGYPVSENARGRDSVRVETIPAMTVAIAQFAGPHRGSGVVWDSLKQWIPLQGYEIAGPPMEVYLRGMRDNADPEENFSEVRWPVRVARTTPPQQTMPTGRQP